MVVHTFDLILSIDIQIAHSITWNKRNCMWVFLSSWENNNKKNMRRTERRVLVSSGNDEEIMCPHLKFQEKLGRLPDKSKWMLESWNH